MQALTLDPMALKEATGREETVRNGLPRLSFSIALIVFLIFVSNVALGGAGFRPFLSDVGEAITLFVSVFAFVVGILQAEAAEKAARR